MAKKGLSSLELDVAQLEGARFHPSRQDLAAPPPISAASPHLRVHPKILLCPDVGRPCVMSGCPSSQNPPLMAPSVCGWKCHLAPLPTQREETSSELLREGRRPYKGTDG